MSVTRSMALRTAVSAEPAPSVPMSRSGQQVVAGGNGRNDGALRHGLFDGLKVLRTRMEEEMNVRVDQARQQGGIAKIDDFRSGGWSTVVPVAMIRSP